MEFGINKKQKVLQWTLRIFLTAACLAMLAFIFSNSLKTGAKSAQQSSTMVDVVQDVASIVAPNSGIATATGVAYDRLHMWVRVVAHFAEFALFGALLLWCLASYSWKKEVLWSSLGGACFLPMVDENIQCFVADRGAEFCDVCVDIAGGLSGLLFAIIVLMAILWLREKRQRKALKKVEQLQ